MLYIAGISISFFLCLLLLSKPRKSLADNILAAWLFFDGLHLFFFYMFITGRINMHPELFGISLPFPLLHGPLLFLYASALTGKFNRFGFRQALHFLPAAISYLYLLPFFNLPASEKIRVFENKGAGYETYMALSSVAIMLSGIVYVVLTSLLHRKHRRQILDEFSYTEKINLDWILYLIIGIALIWVFVILNMDNYVFGTAVFFVMFIGYFGIKQVGIFTPVEHGVIAAPSSGTGVASASISEKIFPEPENAGFDQGGAFPESIRNESEPGIILADFENPGKRKKYLKSGLSQEGAQLLHHRLTQLIETEKIFNNSELTLTELAKKLGTHPNYLSQVINEKEGKNFYDYINTLRTEEFKKLISDPKNQKFTLLSLAFECGFNSKSSFNKYFKKVTGQSPTEYFRSIQATAAA